MTDYEGVIVKQVDTEQPRDMAATVRYMSDLKNGGHKHAHDESGPLAGSINCIAQDRPGQLKEFDHYLRLHGNPRSTQAASHQLISYPSGIIPTREQIERDLLIIMKKYGMEDHPLIWDSHGNTNNFHVHFLLLRVALTPDEHGKHPIADNGLVRKTTKEKTGKKRVRTRTDWSACRQCAVSEISALYGAGNLRNVRRTPDGGLRPRQDSRDALGDKTRAGERRSGKKSRERQLAEMIREVIDLSVAEAAVSRETFWHIADREFSARAIAAVFKMEAGKLVGGYVVGPYNRKCSFSKAGDEYSATSLARRFGPPSIADSAHHTEYDLEPFEYHEHDFTPEEAKKRLSPVFRDAVDAGAWDHLITGIQQQGMRLARSGGGLVVVYNDACDTIKCSDISNKYSLSRLEKILGPCPIEKAAPTVPSARDALIRDSVDIISRWVKRSRGLFQARPELQKIGIQVERKTFTKDGERIKYYVLTRNGVSIPFSALGRDTDGDPYTFNRLRLLDACDPSARHAAWLEWANSQSEVGRQSREAAPMQPFTGTPHNLPGVPFLSEIRDQITRGYHHVARIIGIERIETHHLGHSAGTPASN